MGRRGQRERRVGAVAVATALLSLLAAVPVSAGEVTIEAESMSWPTGSGRTYTDANASQGGGYFNWSNQSGSSQVTTTSALTGLRVRLRGEQFGATCQGLPRVAVKIDNTTRLTASVATGSSYSEPVADVSIPAGAHTVAVGLTNDYDSQTFPCDRNLYVDKVTLVASAVFSPASYRNRPLPDDAPLDADRTYADNLASQIRSKGTWVNTTEWSAPIYVVPADQPKVNVAYDTRGGYRGADVDHLRQDFTGVPLPPDAEPAGPPVGPNVPWSDHSLIVYQPASDTIWEFYHLEKDALGNWKAMDGGRIRGASANDGFYDAWPSGTAHGLTASGIPKIAGMQTIAELQAGAVDHAVGIDIPHALAAPARRSPATRTDGDSTADDAVPEGTRFRLPANLDVDALDLTPYAKMIAKAIQRYGLIVTDKDCVVDCPSSVVFYAEDPRPSPGPLNPNPYDAIFGGVPRHHVFDGFPWDQLEVLPPY